ncbi:TetR/AcrR family transcriptional regulator [Thermomonospora catenispora]|uniref:TetR/AcrR family transcriptional regulator n=1 Tax=Thermomonospora catenispora TaxID=2493090 RepID=UPI00111C9BF4|nr:TetR/AcrR family transcriptional regulator [Thermomonospora catenispora]TNY38366.1 TetR/AcrR family transcriptional regulator [Thermomonospora catenispora]
MSRADRRRQLLETAEQVFAERGFRAVSMDEIAERCGVSKPLLYEHFGSKDGLVQATIDRVRAELYEATSAAMAQARDPREMVWRGMLAYFEFMDAHSRSFMMLLQEPMVVPGGTDDVLEQTRRQQSGLIAPLLAALAPDVPPAAVEAYTEIIIGGCERLALWRLSHPELSARDAARYMTDFTWNALREHVRADLMPPPLGPDAPSGAS